jgi:methyl-accepting chemotaxis protein
VNWTVGRRIIAGFTLSLLLVVVIGAIGWWALERTGDEYGSAVEQERTLVENALRTRGSARSANLEYLRYLLEPDARFIQGRDSAVTAARSAFDVLRREAPEEAGSWESAALALERWVAASEASIAARRDGDMEAALRIRAEQAVPARSALDESIDAGITAVQSITDELIANAHATRDASKTAVIVVAGIALILGVLSAYILYRAISNPLQETGNVLATSAAEILASTTQQASGATESLSAVTETAATVDEVVQTAEQSAQRARAVADSAQRAADAGRQGRDAVEQSAMAMEQVRSQVNSIGESILRLAEQAQAIGEIITTVNELAEQTNLLALNAAIEAARAGEQGRGFSVVAGEIRNLAEQSKAATVRVRQILGEIQRATSTAVVATEQGNKRVEDGARQMKAADQTIRTLADAVAGASQAAAQISASAGQQSTGMSQIKQAVASIQQAAQQNLAATRQAEAAARELNRMGSRLIELVGGTSSNGRPTARSA